MSAIIYAETHSTDPAFNLAFEEYVLLNKKEGSYLMLWQNANTVVVGRNQNTAAEIDADFVRDMGVTVVRRMTGGGAVYHDLGNLNYSFISDLGDAEALSIERFARPVCAALESMGVKAGLSGRNDILAEGKKVSGVAQRIYKDRILHHGTLLFDSDSSMIAGALRAHEEKFTSKSAKSVRSRVGNIRALLPEDMSLEAFWQCILRQLGGEGLEFWQPDGAELEQIEKLAEEKYRSWDWNYGSSPPYSFVNRRRFPQGSLELSMNVEKGIITALEFHGDFMAVQDHSPLTQALLGIRCQRAAVECVLRKFSREMDGMFGGITAENVLELMF